MGMFDNRGEDHFAGGTVSGLKPLLARQDQSVTALVKDLEAHGRLVGSTDAKGYDVCDARVTPADIAATVHRHLGIDYAKTFIKDFNGRPTPIVDHGKAIPELIG